MKLRFPLDKPRHATIISAYAPTLTSTDDAKEQFDDVWKCVLGPHRVGKQNSRGLLQLNNCAEHVLCITNTICHQANKYTTTCMHPRSKQWHLIDYVIIRQRDIQDYSYAWSRELDRPQACKSNI
eukprot:GHVU01151481.1.p1 GENE.GHVU01151481.1~~GHVU01151481.1.p1  ORF type:complete len:125 (-),score=7.98 GHVU01151481.1:143-517(-)